jgi:hypothetical protein
MKGSQDEASIIRGVMIEKKEALGLLKCKVMELEDLIRFAAAHLPHKHNLLPNEILSRIFVVAAQDYGAVAFPIPETENPPQLTVSHVCSHWRMVALSTSKLWSNTRLCYPEDDAFPVVHLHHRWVWRAGILPVTLSIEFNESMDGSDITRALEKIISPFHVKRLLLDMSYDKFVALWDFPETALSRVTEVELDLTVRDGEGSMTMLSSPHHLVARLRSVKLRGDDMARCLDKLFPRLPWSQLRCLEYHEDVESLQPVVDVLRQIPMLERLVLTTVETAIAPEELTMPSLQEFILETCKDMIDGVELDKILRGFIFPSLIKFTLYTEAYWTSETFEILKRQYNLQRLQEVGFLGTSGFILPVSSVLYNSPMLRLLQLERDAIFDDEGITGISNGTLGQLLKKLELTTSCDRDVEEVLGMVEARKQTVDRLIENGCTWKEEITVLSHITIGGEYDKDQYRENVEDLRARAGIKVFLE